MLLERMFLDVGTLSIACFCLVVGAIRWRYAQPRPGGIAASLIAATATTMIASWIAATTSHDLLYVRGAVTMIAVAGTALALLVNLIAFFPGSEEPAPAARALGSRSKARMPAATS